MSNNSVVIICKKKFVPQSKFFNFSQKFTCQDPRWSCQHKKNLHNRGKRYRVHRGGGNIRVRRTSCSWGIPKRCYRQSSCHRWGGCHKPVRRGRLLHQLTSCRYLGGICRCKRWRGRGGRQCRERGRSRGRSRGSRSNRDIRVRPQRTSFRGSQSRWRRSRGRALKARPVGGGSRSTRKSRARAQPWPQRRERSTIRK